MKKDERYIYYISLLKVNKHMDNLDILNIRIDVLIFDDILSINAL